MFSPAGSPYFVTVKNIRQWLKREKNIQKQSIIETLTGKLAICQCKGFLIKAKIYSNICWYSPPALPTSTLWLPRHSQKFGEGEGSWWSKPVPSTNNIHYKSSTGRKWVSFIQLLQCQRCLLIPQYGKPWTTWSRPACSSDWDFQKWLVIGLNKTRLPHSGQEAWGDVIAPRRWYCMRHNIVTPPMLPGSACIGQSQGNGLSSAGQTPSISSQGVLTITLPQNLTAMESYRLVPAARADSELHPKQSFGKFLFVIWRTAEEVPGLLHCLHQDTALFASEPLKPLLLAAQLLLSCSHPELYSSVFIFSQQSNSFTVPAHI